MCESRFYSIQRRLKIGSEKNVFRGGCLKLKKSLDFWGSLDLLDHPFPIQSLRVCYTFLNLHESL